jgi:hypothetical protein
MQYTNILVRNNFPRPKRSAYCIYSDDREYFGRSGPCVHHERILTDRTFRIDPLKRCVTCRPVGMARILHVTKVSARWEASHVTEQECMATIVNATGDEGCGLELTNES